MTLDAGSIKFENVSDGLYLLLNYKNIGWGGTTDVRTLIERESIRTPTLLTQTIMPYAASRISVSGDMNVSGALTVNDFNVLNSSNFSTWCAKSSHTHSFSDITGSLYTRDITIPGGGAGRIAFSNGNGVGWDYAESTYQKSSDLRLKYDIHSVEDISGFYLDLKPKSFKFKAGLYTNITNHGLIAQEVLSNLEKHNIDSGMVYLAENYYDQGQYCSEGTHYNFKYDDLHAFHIKMIQLLWQRVTALEYTIGAITR